MNAVWKIFEDEGAVWLQIELGNGFAVTLTCSKNGDEPAATLWNGNGEHGFNRNVTADGLVLEPGETVETFRAWLDRMAYSQDPVV
jgi:hypothetical protein